MQQLYNSEYIGEAPLELPPTWGLLKGNLERSLEKAVDYHQTNPTYNSNSLLVNLATKLLSYQDLSLQAYFMQIRSNLIEIATAIGINNPVNAGKVFEGCFFSYGSQELVLLEDRSDDLFKVTREWRSADPCRYRHHPNTDFEFILNNNNDAQMREGFVVVGIDILMFAAQLRGWITYQDSLPEEERIGLRRFLNAYPTANMLESYACCSLFNVLREGITNEKEVKTIKNPLFHLPDYGRKIEQFTEKLNEILRRKSLSFEETLKAIPMLGRYKDLHEFQRHSNVYRSSKNRWLHNFSKIYYFNYLFRLEIYTEYGGNKDDKNVIHREFERMRHAKMNANLLDGERHKEAIDLQVKLIQKYL